MSLPSHSERAERDKFPDGPQGTVYIELEVKCRRALSLLIQGWSDDEKQALLDDKEEAREALVHEARAVAMAHADDVNVVIVDIRMGGAARG